MHKHDRAGFFSVEKSLILHYFATRLALKRGATFFTQSEVKPNPIVTLSHTFSRAPRQLHVITSSFDWFIGLSVPFVIG